MLFYYGFLWCNVYVFDLIGIFVVIKVEFIGFGGFMNVVFVCNGCELWMVNFFGLVLVEGFKWIVVGFVLVVVFFIIGYGYVKFFRIFR